MGRASSIKEKMLIAYQKNLIRYLQLSFCSSSTISSSHFGYGTGPGRYDVNTRQVSCRTDRYSHGSGEGSGYTSNSGNSYTGMLGYLVDRKLGRGLKMNTEDEKEI